MERDAGYGYDCPRFAGLVDEKPWDPIATFARITSVTNVAAEITPVAPHSAEVKSGKRSGVRPCKASRIPANIISEPATIIGLREALDKIVVVTK